MDPCGDLRLASLIVKRGSGLTPFEEGFVRAVRRYAREGVGYGFMLQVIQAEAEADEAGERPLMG